MYRSINGVDTKALAEVARSLSQSPELGRFSFRATNRWQSGSRNTTTIADFDGAGEVRTSASRPFHVTADMPEVLLGDDTAPNPVEALLHALAACVTTSMVYHAAARGIRIDDVETELAGNLDLRGFLGLSPGVRQGFEDVELRFRVTTDASAEELRRLCHYSPVLDVVSNGTKVAIEVETNAEPSEERWIARHPAESQPSM